VPPSRRRPLRSRRRLLRAGTLAFAGSLAGCVSGALEDGESGESDTTDTSRRNASRPESSGREVPAGFPEGPKSPPERPANLTEESVREYVWALERRWVYNSLYRDDSTDVHRECGVDSVGEYGEGFQVVVWCSAWANSGDGETTVHADYFTQYATYFVGPDSTVRRDGELKTRG
jgi:hypothetical protein